MSIKVLDKHVSDLIAAGEVIERPASVVKELVENAVDAGATTIAVEIKSGGLSLIRVTDNGNGIPRADVPTAFLRHGTSKITQEDDLTRIATLGFRGEALCSIAAVARVTMMTRTQDETAASIYEIEGGEQGALADGGAPVGTTILVRDLFFNTPARMKFLKKDVYEASAVATLLDHIALSRPDISFRFIKDGKQELLTPGDGALLSAIYAVFGKAFAESLLAARDEQNGIAVTGYVTKPAACKGNRSFQNFYVNGRYIKSPSCSAALEEAYKHSVMIGKFPGCVLDITLPHELVDVNVHPAKTQVRFQNERAVFGAVYCAVKNALMGDRSVDEVPLDDVVKPSYVAPAPEPAPASKATPDTTSARKPVGYTYETADSYSIDPNRTARRDPIAAQPWAQAVWTAPTVPPSPPPAPIDPPQTAVPPVPPAVAPSTLDIVRDDGELSLIGEAFGVYILAQRGDDILIIDKHAAHERMLYNELKDKTVSDVQLLLEPAVVTMGKDEAALVLEHRALFADAGFDLDDYGAGSIVVRGVPSVLSREDVAASLHDALDAVRRYRPHAEFSMLDEVLHSVACRAAIKSHDRSSPRELLTLAARVLDENIRHCPHGRPVSMKITRKSLEKQFGRT